MPRAGMLCLEHPPAVCAVKDSFCLSPRGAGIQSFPPATPNSNRFCSAARERSNGKKSASSPDQQGAPLCPRSTHREGLKGSPGTPNSQCLCPITQKRRSWLCSQAQATPCIQKKLSSPGGGSKTQPHSRNKRDRAEPALPVPPLGSSTLQCQLNSARRAWQLLSAHLPLCSSPSAILPPQHSWQS